MSIIGGGVRASQVRDVAPRVLRLQGDGGHRDRVYVKDGPFDRVAAGADGGAWLQNLHVSRRIHIYSVIDFNQVNVSHVGIGFIVYALDSYDHTGGGIRIQGHRSGEYNGPLFAGHDIPQVKHRRVV